MICVVLGMHKSGTSLVAEILHKSGILMIEKGEEITGGKKHAYERLAFQQLNKDILGCRNTFSLDIGLPRQIMLRPQHRQRLTAAIHRCEARNEDWGFKDPRTCLTYAVWKEHLPAHRLIVVYRHPDQVKRHYCAKSARRFWKALRVWTIYNVRILEALQTVASRSVVINYERLMSDAVEFDRLSAFMGRALVDARRTERYRHRRVGGWQTLWVDYIMRGIGLQSPLHTYRALEALRALQVKPCETV
jgi:hypothetical protein